jgi:2-polyprenyl-3-methyl-5-hydroxy-6-metoxy-1,4-benzoquinol methylase
VPIVVDPDGVERTTLRELVDVRGLRVLDVGCGDGRLSYLCAEEGAASVHGIDPDEESIALARAEAPPGLRRRLSFAVANAAEAELPRREFDLALFSWSL